MATVGLVAMPIEPFALTGTHVRLEPLDRDHAAELARAGAIDRTSYTYTPVPDGLADAERYIDWLLTDRDRGLVVPFAQRRLDTGELVGCTRYLELRHWRGRATPDEVEIGGTWLAASVRAHRPQCVCVELIRVARGRPRHKRGQWRRATSPSRTAGHSAVMIE